MALLSQLSQFSQLARHVGGLAGKLLSASIYPEPFPRCVEFAEQQYVWGYFLVRISISCTIANQKNVAIEKDNKAVEG